jgi:FAD/FMN-containing dehydrogenase
MEAQQSTTLGDETTQAFTSRLQGQLIRPGDDQYDEARGVWNGMIDKRPACIVRCANAADVITSINFARENHLLVAIRGGDTTLQAPLSAMTGSCLISQQ